MSSDHGETRSSDDTESWSSDNWSRWSTTSLISSMGASTPDTDDDALSGHRRRKRWRSPAAPHHNRHSWVLLNRAGARLDDYDSPAGGDRATSATSRTSNGKEISVAFELVEPPGTSVLTVDCPRTSSASVVAAHRDVVLLAITSEDDKCAFHEHQVLDLIVYQAAASRRRRRRRPSLSRLPSAGGPVLYSQVRGTEGMGDGYDVLHKHRRRVAVVRRGFPCDVDVSQDQRRRRPSPPGSGKWEALESLRVRGASGGRDLRWWSTDAVVPYGRRHMMWVDYYRGMVVMDLSSSSSPEKKKNPPRLRYVPLPVDTVGNPVDIEYDCRGCPEASRSVCVTRYGVKFVSVDTQHWSSFGVGHGHVLKWSHRFRVTTWWLREDGDGDDGDTWRWSRDATMHEDEFWDAFDGGHRYSLFPHVQPEFPVVDVDNPDVVVFRLKKPGGRRHRDEPTWMIEVDLRRKVLLAATAYSSSSKESDGLSGDAGAINSARMESGFDPIPSELPRYMEDDDGGQAAYNKRRR